MGDWISLCAKVLREVADDRVDDAAALLKDLSSEELHALMGCCLITAGLARSAIVGSSAEDPSGIRSAHEMVDRLEVPDSLG
jgi:hypothetical protein